MTKLDSILKSGDITLPTKVHLVKNMVFPVVMHGCESCAFELWCWRRLLRVPWTKRRSNQSILMEITPEYSLEGLISIRMEISPEYSLEGLMLKLKLQSFGDLM